jgi:hypothetical protein
MPRRRRPFRAGDRRLAIDRGRQQLLERLERIKGTGRGRSADDDARRGHVKAIAFGRDARVETQLNAVGTIEFPDREIEARRIRDIEREAMPHRSEVGVCVNCRRGAERERASVRRKDHRLGDHGVARRRVRLCARW